MPVPVEVVDDEDEVEDEDDVDEDDVEDDDVDEEDEDDDEVVPPFARQAERVRPLLVSLKVPQTSPFGQPWPGFFGSQ